MKYRYKYSRKEIIERLERFMPLGSKMDAPTIWSHLNQFRIDLLSTLPERECHCGYHEVCDICQKITGKDVTSPSLDGLEEIEELDPYDYEGALVETIQSLIRNQNAIIKKLKSL